MIQSNIKVGLLTARMFNGGGLLIQNDITSVVTCSTASIHDQENCRL